MNLQAEFDKYTISTEIVTRVNDNNTVIIMKMDDSDSFFKVHGIAASFWPVLEKKAELSSVVDTILDEYDITQDRIENDVTEFLANLSKLDFIVKS